MCIWKIAPEWYSHRGHVENSIRVIFAPWTSRKYSRMISASWTSRKNQSEWYWHRGHLEISVRMICASWSSRKFNRNDLQPAVDRQPIYRGEWPVEKGTNHWKFNYLNRTIMAFTMSTSTSKQQTENYFSENRSFTKTINSLKTQRGLKCSGHLVNSMRFSI